MKIDCTLHITDVVPPLPRSERGRPSKIHISPQGNLLVYPSSNVVALLNVDDLSVIHIFRQHRFETTAVKFSPDGQFIASGDKGGEVFVCQTEAPFEHKYKHVIGGEISDIAWSPDGKKIAVVGDGKPVYFELKTGSSGGDLSCHSRRIESIDIHPNIKDNMILMASHDSRISIFDRSKGGPRPKYSQQLTTHSKEVYTVAFNNDGSLFVSGGSDGRLVVYDTVTKAVIGERKHDRSITSAAFISLPSLAKGDTVDFNDRICDLIVYASTDGYVRALRLLNPDEIDESGTQIKDEWEWNEKGDPSLTQRLALAVSVPFNCVIVISSSGKLEKIRASSGESISSLYGHKGHIRSIDIHNQFIITGDNSGRLCLSIDDAPVVPFGIQQTKAIRGLSISSSNDTILVLRMNNELQFYSLSESTVLSTVSLPSEPVSMSCGRSLIAIACHSHLVIIDKSTRHIVCQEKLSADSTSISIIYDDSQIAIGDVNGIVTVYTIKDGNTLNVIKEMKMKGSISQVGYSPTGHHIAICDSARYVNVYSIDENNEWILIADDWRLHCASIRSMGWNTNGTALATGAVDRSLIVWKLPEDGRKFDPIIHRSGHIVEDIGWCSHNEMMTVGEDGCRIIWTLK